MKIAFVDKPTIDFSLKLIGGDINTIPFGELAETFDYEFISRFNGLAKRVWYLWEKRGRERTRTLAVY